jgi:hypothetical protein
MGRFTTTSDDVDHERAQAWGIVLALLDENAALQAKVAELENGVSQSEANLSRMCDHLEAERDALAAKVQRAQEPVVQCGFSAECRANYDRAEKAEAERDALTATVERVKWFAKHVWCTDRACDRCNDIFGELPPDDGIGHGEQSRTTTIEAISPVSPQDE